VYEKGELGVPDTDGVAVRNELASNGNSIHEGAVAGVGIENLILFAHSLDGALPPRHFDIEQTGLMGFVKANRDSTVDQGPDGASELT
jgi:hypothetical protein